MLGKVGVEETHSNRSLVLDGSRVWVCSPTEGLQGWWDFGIPGSSPTQLTIPLPSHLNKTELWGSNQPEIKKWGGDLSRIKNIYV